MTTSPLQTLLDGVARLSESELDSVVRATRIRREQLNAMNAAANMEALVPGARVRVRDNIRPMYLQGLTALVQSVTAYEVKLNFEDEYAAGRFAKGCRCKLHMVEVIA